MGRENNETSKVKKKKVYTSAEIEIIDIDASDIICTSGENIDPDQGGWMPSNLWTPEN